MNLEKSLIALLILGCAVVGSATGVWIVSKAHPESLGSSAEDFIIKCENSTSTTMNIAANTAVPIATTSPTRVSIKFSASTTDNPEAIWIQKGPQLGVGVAAGKGAALYGTGTMKIGSEEHYTGIYWAVSKVAARLVVEECYQ